MGFSFSDILKKVLRIIAIVLLIIATIALIIVTGGSATGAAGAWFATTFGVLASYSLVIALVAIAFLISPEIAERVISGVVSVGTSVVSGIAGMLGSAVGSFFSSTGLMGLLSIGLMAYIGVNLLNSGILSNEGSQSGDDDRIIEDKSSEISSSLDAKSL